MNQARIVISALRGGSGKTMISIGITAAWAADGKSVVPFKKGPDYIDAGWLGLAAGQPCRNLDTYLCSRDHALQSFLTYTSHQDIAVIEGNRGIYDAISIEGDASTAELSKLLAAPVILCLDCTKTTRTMAAVVMGCTLFDSETQIKGVILNRVAGPRHERILRNSIEHHCGVPVVGAIPKLDDEYFPERHMGLVPTPEHSWAVDSIRAARETAEKHIDLKALESIARTAGPVFIQNPVSDPASDAGLPTCTDIRAMDEKIKIGILKDAAFQFYYPENIEALEKEGADIIFISPLTDDTIPDVDALYIGGGFPETHAAILAEQVSFRNQIREMAENGLPIYAECGGLMYLGEKLVLDHGIYPMTGVLPLTFGFSKKPQGHGYTRIEVDQANPYFETATSIRGHEFHYSSVIEQHEKQGCDFVFAMKRGKGILNKRDGMTYKNVLATYTHLHASGCPQWAKAVFQQALSHKNR